MAQEVVNITQGPLIKEVEVEVDDTKEEEVDDTRQEVVVVESPGTVEQRQDCPTNIDHHLQQKVHQQETLIATLKAQLDQVTTQLFTIENSCNTSTTTSSSTTTTTVTTTPRRDLLFGADLSAVNPPLTDGDLFIITASANRSAPSHIVNLGNVESIYSNTTRVSELSGEGEGGTDLTVSNLHSPHHQLHNSQTDISSTAPRLDEISQTEVESDSNLPSPHHNGQTDIGDSTAPQMYEFSQTEMESVNNYNNVTLSPPPAPVDQTIIPDNYTASPSLSYQHSKSKYSL